MKTAGEYEQETFEMLMGEPKPHNGWRPSDIRERVEYLLELEKESGGRDELRSHKMELLIVSSQLQELGKKLIKE